MNVKPKLEVGNEYVEMIGTAFRFDKHFDKVITFSNTEELSGPYYVNLSWSKTFPQRKIEDTFWFFSAFRNYSARLYPAHKNVS